MRYAALAGLALATLSATTSAQTTLTTERLVSGLSQPIYACAPEGDDRLFICQQNGIIRILKDGALLPTPFLNISGLVTNGGECGLLGMAFHPDYRENGKYYLHYSVTGCNTRIFEYTVSANPDVSNPTGVFKFNYAQPFSNHNGGMIEFGPDGYLYVALGDGGSGGDPGCRAQNRQNLLGKILRIDINDTNPGTAQYVIPPTNPFVGDPTTADEIYHLGVRNPWRFSFDRLTGDMYIGDVGQNAWEEISVAPAGAAGLNFGWKMMEGNACFGTGGCSGVPACNSSVLTDPVHVQSNGPWFSITGGYVYRGCAIPDLQGTYFFADYIADVIRSFEWNSATNSISNLTTRTLELSPPPGNGLIRDIASFGEDGFGELLIVDRGGEIFKIVPNGPVAGLVDCDGDGLDDNCELMMFDWVDLNNDGILDSCQGLSADSVDVSVSAGTRQNWSLHAPAAEAGALYWVVGSLSGTAPGINIQGFNIPVNFPDTLFNYTLNQPNTAPLVNTLGILNGAAEASAAFDAGTLALPASLAGQTSDQVYVTIVGGQIQYVSNTISTQYIP